MLLCNYVVHLLLANLNWNHNYNYNLHFAKQTAIQIQDVSMQNMLHQYDSLLCLNHCLVIKKCFLCDRFTSCTLGGAVDHLLSDLSLVEKTSLNMFLSQLTYNNHRIIS